jgi:hypothetical protein
MKNALRKIKKYNKYFKKEYLPEFFFYSIGIMILQFFIRKNDFLYIIIGLFLLLIIQFFIGKFYKFKKVPFIIELLYMYSNINICYYTNCN